MDFSCMMTLEDWSARSGTWGEGGVAVMTARLMDAGIQKALWRTGPAGLAYYPSRVRDLQPQPLELYEQYPSFSSLLDPARARRQETMRQLFDYRSFDLIEAALRQGEHFGVRVSLWSEITSEAHGSYPYSRFVRNHPEFLSVNREGRRFETHLSWACPEVRSYKLAVVRELLDYGIEELVLDFWKGSCDLRDRRLDDEGYWYGGYEEVCVAAFRATTGRDPLAIPNSDPEWVRFRADYVSEFLREVRKLQTTLYPSTAVATFDHVRGKRFPWWDTSRTSYDEEGERELPFLAVDARSAGHLEGNLEDVATWTREGLCDAVYACCNFEGEREHEDYGERLNSLLSEVAPPARKRAYLSCWTLTSEQEVMRYVREAHELGVDELLFCESSAIEDNRLWDACARAVKEFGGAAQTPKG